MKTLAVIHAQHGAPLLLDEIEIPSPGADDVIVQLFASGICGSQLYNLTSPGVALPELLGHEGTGIVIQAGGNVTHVQEGDHVLVSWMPYNANENTEYLQWREACWRGQNIRSVIFTWAKHAIMHSQFVSKMPKDFEKYTTAIIGCAGITGYGTVLNTVKVYPGQSVVIFGVGGLGVLSANAARNLKAHPIIAVDIDDEKLQFSRTFGVTHTINSKKVNPIEEIQKLTKGGADFVFDMVGTPETRDQTILATRPGIAGYSEGGTTVLVGFSAGISEFNTRPILMGQRTYKGSRGGACKPAIEFPVFYQLYREGKLLLDEAVTRRTTLDQINEVISDFLAGKICGRAIIEIS